MAGDSGNVLTAPVDFPDFSPPFFPDSSGCGVGDDFEPALTLDVFSAPVLTAADFCWPFLSGEFFSAAAFAAGAGLPGADFSLPRSAVLPFFLADAASIVGFADFAATGFAADAFSGAFAAGALAAGADFFWSVFFAAAEAGFAGALTGADFAFGGADFAGVLGAGLIEAFVGDFAVAFNAELDCALGAGDFGPEAGFAAVSLDAAAGLAACLDVAGDGRRAADVSAAFPDGFLSAFPLGGGAFLEDFSTLFVAIETRLRNAFEPGGPRSTAGA